MSSNAWQITCSCCNFAGVQEQKEENYYIYNWNHIEATGDLKK